MTHSKIVTFITALTISIVGFSLIPEATVHAADSSDFNPGRIIDDSIFYNENALDNTSIQSFLDSKTTCDTYGTKTASEFGSSLTRAQYAASKGWQAPPYTCLRDYKQDTPQIEAASGLCSGIASYTARTSAQIINDVAKACHINPKVILVLLQKEQALVLDEWPLNSQYEHATGYACPDTAACNPAYAGFFYQVYNAAKQYQIYKNYPNSYNYIAGQNNYVYYNPNLSCGGSTIYIENQATAALYIYTPYQPNSAALNNLYGLGDACSAYGNRNFWRLFTDWFGSTHVPNFKAEYRAQSNNITVEAGTTQTIYVQFTNTGSGFWKDDMTTFPGYYPVHLAATNPINRASIFKSSDWLNSSRPNGTFTKVLRADGWNLAPDQHTVQPGEIAEFQFQISVPSDQKSGTYREYFQPILEGATNFNMNTWTYFDINVTGKTYEATYQSQTSPYPSGTPGTQTSAFFKIKNTGTATWQDDQSSSQNQIPVHLATTGPINRASIFKSSDWLNSSRPNGTFTKVYLADGVTEAPDQHTVQPGQVAMFEFTIKIPSSTPTGTYREYFQPILEGSRNFDMKLTLFLDIRVDSQTFSASYLTQSAYPTITRGSSTKVNFKLQNSGNMFWKDDQTTFPGYFPVHLATTGPINRTSIFKSNDWLNNSRPNGTFTKVYLADGVTEAPDQHTVQPGQVAMFEFTITAPADATPGTYREYFQPILEGASNYTMNVIMFLDIQIN